MKFKTIIFVLFVLSQISLVAKAVDIKENVFSDLSDIKSALQQSNSKVLNSFVSKIDSISSSINTAISDSESVCDNEIDNIISRLDDLSSKIDKRKCKNHKSKKSQCVPLYIAGEIVSKISYVSDLLNSSDDGEIFDICKVSDSGDNGETNDTINTATDSNVISGCSQGETLKLSDVLNSDKLTLSTMAVVDTKLDLGNIEFYKYPLSMGDVFIAKNTSYIPVEVMVLLDSSTNVSYDIPTVIPLLPKSQGYAFEVCVLDDSEPWNYKYSFADEQGFSTSAYNGDGKYFLPFKAGESHIVAQGEMGAFSHFGEFLYSIDFGMPEGTEVTAMRNGTVVFIKEDSNEGGPDKLFLDKANFIWILHSDNSIARYVHLKQNGVLVNVGDKVKTGDLIGLSGNTGYTSGPHLHVQVVLQKGFSETDLIPIRFKGIDGALVEGQSYTAIPIVE